MPYTYLTNARANILGNPSDIYYGIGISSTIDELGVVGRIESSDTSKYLINGLQDPEFDMLIEYTLKFLEKKGFTLTPFFYSITNNIPKQGGLAGSSAIIVNLLNCLSQLFHLHLSKREIAHMCFLIEHEEIGLTAGQADRFIITFGGTKYMDFTCKDYNEFLIEEICLKDVPLWIGIRTKEISSGDIHKFPYNVYSRNKQLQEVVDKLMKCAVIGKEAIYDQNTILFGQMMHENQQLTNLYGSFGEPSKEVKLQRQIDTEILKFCAVNNILGAKLVGSSGSIIILHEDKPDFLMDFKLSRQLGKKLPPELNYGLINEIIKLKPGNNR